MCWLVLDAFRFFFLALTRAACDSVRILWLCQLAVGCVHE